MEVFETLFIRENCILRKDVKSACSCLCPVFHEMVTYEASPIKDCNSEVQDYFLYGRIGIPDTAMSRDCENAVCEFFPDARESWQCQSEVANVLPTKPECLALHLPQVPVTCPWVTGTMHSGENDIMECVDGHRCNVTNDGYECCAVMH